MSEYYGEIAAIVTGLCWAWNSIFFMNAGKIVGSPTVNRLRILMAFVFLAIIHFFMLGSFFPVQAETSSFFWLALSGIAGFVLGDSMLFEAFVVIGARLSMLLMCLVPLFSALIGWLCLSETLTAVQILAIFVTLVGICFVILERQNNNNVKNKKYLLGIIFDIGAALGQASGIIFAKFGLKAEFIGTQEDLSPISGTLIRALVGVIGLWFIAFIKGKPLNDFRKVKKSGKALKYIMLGAFIGPTIGVSLSLYSIQHADVGVATTLMQLSPVFLIFILFIFYKEKITLRAILGTIIAVAGASLLILSDKF